MGNIRSIGQSFSLTENEATRHTFLCCHDIHQCGTQIATQAAARSIVCWPIMRKCTQISISNSKYFCRLNDFASHYRSMCSCVGKFKTISNAHPDEYFLLFFFHFPRKDAHIDLGLTLNTSHCAGIRGAFQPY